MICPKGERIPGRTSACTRMAQPLWATRRKCFLSLSSLLNHILSLLLLSLYGQERKDRIKNTFLLSLMLVMISILLFRKFMTSMNIKKGFFSNKCLRLTSFMLTVCLYLYAFVFFFSIHAKRTLLLHRTGMQTFALSCRL